LVNVLTAEEQDALMADFRKFAGSHGELLTKPLTSVSPPGMLTSTVDKEQFQIGIHVDFFASQSAERRAIPRNRLCVNISDEPRFLHLFNVKVTDMPLYIPRAGEVKRRPEWTGESVWQAFMYAFPEYPVLKMRIEPGEGYLAPTENLIHDGCTVGMTSWDVTIHLLLRPSPTPRLSSIG
jgi:hypothetical protein